MYVSMNTDSKPDGTITFRLHALKMGDYYLCSKRFGYHDFHVPGDWDAHPTSVAILETISNDREKPIVVSLGDARIRIDPVIASELFDCLLAFTIINDHQ